MNIRTGAGVLALAASVVAIAAAGAVGPASPAVHQDSPRAELTLTAATTHRPGPGWALATWSRSRDAAGTLFLIDPAGHRRAVAKVPAHAEPVMWSPNGKRVIVTSDRGAVEITLSTGHAVREKFLDDNDVEPVAYTHPRGRAILAAVFTEVPDSTGSHLTDRLERFGLDGRHQKSYPVSIKGAGELDARAAIGNRAGTELVVGARRGLVLLRNNGSVVRRLLAGKRDCTVSSWWHRDVALASCNGTLWAAPISGAHATRLTTGASKTNPFGYSTEWRYSRGRLGLAINGCGPQSLVRFRADGNGVRFDVPQPIAKKGTPHYVGHAGDRVLMTVSPGVGCLSGATTLFAYNAVTHHSKALLGPTVNGGTVQGALVYPQD